MVVVGAPYCPRSACRRPLVVEELVAVQTQAEAALWCEAHGPVRWEDDPVQVGPRVYCPFGECDRPLTEVLAEDPGPTLLEQVAEALRRGSPWDSTRMGPDVPGKELRVGVYARRVELLMGEYVDGRFNFMDGDPMDEFVSERTAAREVRLATATLFRAPTETELQRLEAEERRQKDLARLKRRQAKFAEIRGRRRRDRDGDG